MTRQESFLKPDFSLELFIMQEEISLVDVRFLILKHITRRATEMADNETVTIRAELFYRDAKEAK